MVIFVKLVLLNISNKSFIFSGSPNAELVSEIYTYCRNAKILFGSFEAKELHCVCFSLKTHYGTVENTLIY